MSKHPMYHAICLWASEPEAWVWQHPIGSRWISCGSGPPTPTDFKELPARLVHRDWLRDPESVTVFQRERGSEKVQLWIATYNSTWDHEIFEYRVESRARTGRMTEAPKVGTRYAVPRPDLASWHDRYAWDNSGRDWLRLGRGLCHHDDDSAIAAAKRMTENAQQGNTGDDER